MLNECLELISYVHMFVKALWIFYCKGTNEFGNVHGFINVSNSNRLWKLNHGKLLLCFDIRVSFYSNMIFGFVGLRREVSGLL